MSNRFFAKILLAALVLAGVSLATPASAATVPPWEPDANSLGSLSFHDTTGKVITGGTNLSHLFDYAAASSATTRETTKATVYFAFPDHTQADTSNWFTSARSSGSVFPNSANPAPLNGYGSRPVAFAKASEANLKALLGSTVLDQTDGYKDLLQVRVYDTGPGVPQDTTFWSTDIMYDPTAGTWTQVYPAVASATATSTSVTASPASPSTVGTNVTFTAKVTPSAAAGTVQFKDGNDTLGAAVAVSGGTAIYSTTALTQGTHSITAVFTPTDTAAYSGSTSPAISYVVNAAPATATTTTLAVSPSSPATSGTAETLTATVSPTAAAGSVQFKDGSTNIGSPVTVANGTATTTTTLGVGSHSLTAVFTPTDSSAYVASTSNTVTYSVNNASAVTTTTTLTVSPSSPAASGTVETLTATVSPTAAAGSVQFKDGSTNIGSAVAVTNGTATTTTTLGSGTHSLTAVFTPTDATAYGTSNSTPLTYVVNPAQAAGTTTTLDVSPAGPSAGGTVQTLTATVTPTAAAGTVQFKDGTTDIGSPVTVSNGTASTTTTLAPGSHTLTAVFTPTDTAVYTGSTSAEVTYSVNAATTALTITTPVSSPYGKVFTVGTTVTKARTKAPLADVAVQLFRKPAGQTTYTLAKTVTTDSAGAASFALVGTANTIFQWRYAGTATQQAANSALKATTVTQIVSVARTPATFKRGGTVKLYGAVSPATVGQTVYFQSFVNNKWTTQLATKIAKQKMPDGRTYVGYQFAAKLTKPGAYGFRSYAPPTSTLGGTVSAPLPVRVT